MRTFLVAAAVFYGLLVLNASWMNAPAYAQSGCTGENCQPEGRSGGGCERDKADQSVS